MSRLFDAASNQYLSVASAPATNDSMTLSAWIYPTSLGVDQDILSVVQAGSSTDALRLRLRAANTVSATAESQSATSVGTVSANTWYHVAARFDGSTDRSVFLDGVETNSTGFTSVGTAQDTLFVGATNISVVDGYFTGRIARISVHNTPLSNDQITELSLGAPPDKVEPSSLVFFLEAIRDDDFDIIGGLSLTASGSPTIADHPPSILYPSPPIFMVAAAAAGSSAGIIVPSTRHPSRNPILRL